MTALQIPTVRLAPSKLVPPGSHVWRNPRTWQLPQHSHSAGITIYEAHLYSKATSTDNHTMQSNTEEYCIKLSYL